jgi:hypothetical protein
MHLESKPAADTTPSRRLKIIGTVASAALFIVALVVLYVIIRDLDGGQVRAAFAATDGQQFAKAALFTTLSYLMLTGYDALALQQLAVKVRYRIAALASFSSYAVSFTLGFPLLTAGTVRYWIYAPQGLSARQIASLTLIAGVTFWLGMGVVLGFFLLSRPGEIATLNRLPVAMNLMLGAAILLGILGYLIWVARGRRVLSVQGWQLTLPSLPVTLGQAALGALDVCAGGAVLYVLLPVGHSIPYESFIAAYVLACILGIASHAPGGLGVFEATILLALPGIPKEQLLGSLLMFRLCYYLVPFMLALALLGGREIFLRWTALQRQIDREAPVSEPGKLVPRPDAMAREVTPPSQGSDQRER